MRGQIQTYRVTLGFAVMLLALLLGGCDAENPTAPVEQKNPPVTGTTSSATWNITVTADPDTFDLTQGGIAQIEVTARRNDNGARVQTGTTARLSTTAGTLSSASGSGSSVPIEFDAGGVARASLSTGTSTAPLSILVRAQIESSFGSKSIDLVEVEEVPFQITDVSPSFGPPTGTRVSISGSGFQEPLRVNFIVNGQSLPAENIRLSGSSRISCDAPSINLAAGQNAVATVQVQNAFDSTGNPTATDSLSGAFTYTRSSQGTTTLKLISITPTFGPNEGGTQVTILGEGFGDEVQVYFTNGPLVESTVLDITPSRLEVVTPSATGPNASNANSIVDVIVRDPVSGQQDTLDAAYQYGRGGGGALFISSVSPNQSEYTGLDPITGEPVLVTIFGQGFEEPVAVSAGGLAQSVISVSGTEIVFRPVPADTGCSPQAGTVGVTNIETNESTTGPSYTYYPVEPTITGVDPGIGDATGGNTVTIFGLARGYRIGFDPPVNVTFDGVPATVVSVDPFAGTVTVIVPQYTGSFPTQQCDAGGGTAGTQRVPARVDVQVTNLPTGCSSNFSDGYSYRPPAGLATCTAGGGGGGTLTAAFTAETDADDPGLGALDVRVTDTSTSSGTITSWSWDFGDGTMSNVQTPFGDGVHTYAVPGFYDIELTVEDDQGLNDTAIITVDVN